MNTQSELVFEAILKKKLNSDQIKEYNRKQYGREEHCELHLKCETKETCRKANIDVAAYYFTANREELRNPRIVKIGLIQHSIVLPTDKTVQEQRNAIFQKVHKLIDLAASEGVQVLCLQESWSMPFFLCTKEKDKWQQFAEPAFDGPSTIFLSKLAKKNNMVIVSPILENDNGTWWNTAVVIEADGKYLGKHRKNHLPSVGSFSETSFYKPGDLGHAVFDTKYAKIAVNICYGRHHALNWLMFGLNGAEVVFNPAATVAEFGESFWNIEARNAAIANSYFTCSINRVGTESFTKENGDKISRTYYGSSYITAPDGCRTPNLSRVKDGLLISDIDLNLCRQVKDQWGFNMTSRLSMYADKLALLNKT